MDISKILERYQQNGNYSTEKKRIAQICDPAELMAKFMNIAVNLPGGYDLNDTNKEIIAKLCMYFSAHPDVPDNLLRKGIMLVGNPGSGKTTIMRIFSQIIPFQFMYCHSICDSVRKDGQEAMDKVHQKSHDEICFDDLGGEQKVKFYGNSIDAMYDIIIKRCLNMVHHNTRTHITTNLTMEEIKSTYDARIESRLHEMCNVFVLGGSSNYIDFRKK